MDYPELFRIGLGTENVGPLLRALVQMSRPSRILEIGAGYYHSFHYEKKV